MPCLVVLIALSAPRLAIILVVLFSDYIGDAYQSHFVAFLGFLFLPLTTLAYAYAIHTHGKLEGVPLGLYVVALLIDLGLLGTGARQSQARA